MISKKIVTDYKSKVSGKYVSVPADQITFKIMESDYYLCSIKYDGHFGMLAMNAGQAVLYNRSGEELKIPAILDEAIKIPVQGTTILAGEIIVMKDGKAANHSIVASAIAKPENYDIRFAAYDVTLHNDQTTPEDPKEKHKLIESLLSKSKNIFVVEQNIFDSRKDVASFYSQIVPEHEGIVVRSSTGFTYKVKPLITLDLIVLGYAESVGERAGLLRDLLLGYITEDGVYHIVAKCGGGFSTTDREELLKKLAPMQVQSEYTEVSSAKTAFVMIKPELVAEITCLDLINENSNGAVKKMTLRYDPQKGYTNEHIMNGVTCTSPVFYRFRTDKKADTKDAGLEQITNHREILVDEMILEDLHPSVILKKEVYTKVTKGSTAVRKMTILKTNKEETALYPPFIMIYTDYSAGRKSPLDQDIYICQTEAEALKKLEEVKIENIKKGWNAAQ